MQMSDVGLPPVLIVGAGTAGLACARRLTTAGIACMLLEKSRGVGGRVATRRVGEDSAEYGCPVLQGHQLLREPWVSDALHRGELKSGQSETDHFLLPNGNGGLRGVFHRLQEKLTIRLESKVERIRFDSDVVSLEGSNGLSLSAATVVLTAPLQQALTLIRGNETAPLVDAQLDNVRYSKTIAVVAQLEGELLSSDAVIEWPSGVLAKAVLHPGQGRTGLTLYGRPGYAEANWDAEAAFFLQAFQGELFDHKVIAAGARLTVLHFHRWRYSQALNPLPQPFWSTQGRSKLYLAGDGFSSGGLEGAWRSGLAVAEDIILEH